MGLGLGGLGLGHPSGNLSAAPLLGIPIATVATVAMWDGRVGRVEGAILVLLYVGYVGAIWIRRGFSSSGISRMISIRSKPLSRVAPVTFIWSASLKACRKLRNAKP